MMLRFFRITFTCVLLIAGCASQKIIGPAAVVIPPVATATDAQQGVAAAVEQQYAGLHQFRGNNTHTFYGTGPLPEHEPKLLWRFKTGVIERTGSEGERHWQGLGWTGQPAIAQEQVKNEKRWVVYAASLDGFVYKLDLLTGELLLKSAQNFDIMKSSPTLTAQYVIVGSWANGMHILDRQTLKRVHTEEAIYTPSASFDFDGSAAIEDGYAWFGGEDGYVRKISLQPPFERLWVFPASAPQSNFLYKDVKPYVGIESSVAVHGNTVVAAAGRGWVYFLDKNTGALQAEFETGDDTDSSPLIDPANGDVYIGVERDFSQQPGGLYKLNAQGIKQWFFPVEATGVYSSAAFYRDTVIFPADDGYLYAVAKSSGALVWKTKLPAYSSWSSPVVIGDRVMVGDYGSFLSLFDAATGAKIWQKRLPGYIVGTPAVWGGVIVVGTRDGYINALQ
jgi:outer membrane protein assembly factor BamB